MFAKQLLSIFCIFLLANAALAQTKTSANEPSSNSVTASVTTAGAIRLAGSSQVSQIRVEVINASGEVVFDSGVRAGNVIDWNEANAGSSMVDGSYLLVVTTKDLQGKSTQTIGAILRQAAQSTLKRNDELTAAQNQALDARKQTLRIEAAQDPTSLVILSERSDRSLVVTAHDGENAQVTATNGALTLGTGDFYSGRNTEQMRITPEGRVGIGTDKPEATLDVAGEVRARGGIRFADGTLLTTAGEGNSKEDSPTANASGIGTTNQLARWTDNAGTLGDSVITETSGRIGIGTNTPSYKLVVGPDIGAGLTTSDLTVSRGVGQSVSAYVGASGSRGINFGWDEAASRGFVNAPAGTPFAFTQAGVNERMRIHSNGNIGIGSNNPSYNLVVGPDLGPGLLSAGLTVSKGAGQSASVYVGPSTANGINFGWDQASGRGFVNAPGTSAFAFTQEGVNERMRIHTNGNIGIGVTAPTEKLEVAGTIKLNGAGTGIRFSDGSVLTSAVVGGGAPSGTSLVAAINDPGAAGTINENRLSSNLVRFAPSTFQLSVGDANGTFPMMWLRGGSTCCTGPGGHTPADFKVFQNGSFVATGNLGIGVSPMEGKGYRTSWHTYKGAFRSGYADNEWDDANVGFFSWAGGSNSTASGLYALAFGDTNFAESTSSIVFGSGNQVKGAAGFSAGAGNRVCDTYGVALGNNARSGGPYINGKCDPDAFNLHGLAAVAIGYNVTADQDHTMAFGKWASNNGFTGTFVWSDGSATASAETFRNSANNEFAARATGGFRFRTNLAGTTGCNLPAGSGVFNCTSSRYTKENFSFVKGSDVLSQLRAVPVSTWNYISEGNKVRHMGPMAEDFYQAFQLGVSNTAIGVQDLAGVSLSAIKELDERTSQQSSEVEHLRTEVNHLRNANQALEQRLAALEKALERATPANERPQQ
jgi:trimeric autotransporter adhesin